MKSKWLLLLLVALLTARCEVLFAQKVKQTIQSRAAGSKPAVAQAQSITTPEPTYENHPLSYWLEQQESTSSVMPTPLKESARVAIADIGTNAIPFLLTQIRQRTGEECGVIGAFEILGPSARSAIPELAALIDREVQMFSARTNVEASSNGSGVFLCYTPLLSLGGIGPEAVPAITPFLKKRYTWRPAIEAIERMGTNGAAAVPALIEMISNDGEYDCRNAVKALGIVGAADPAAIKVLSELSENSYSYVSRYIYVSGQISVSRHISVSDTALSALARCGSRGAPALIKGLNDPKNDFTAFASLVAASPSSLTNAEVLSIAAKALNSRDPDRSDLGARILYAAGQQAMGLHPDVYLPSFKMPEIRTEATNALRRLAPELLSKNSP